MILIFLACLVISGTSGGRLRRLVGGYNVEIEDVPYQVSLRVPSNIHICGGSLISTRHVLTAAHCVYNLFAPPYEEITVVTGAKSLKTGGTSHNVKSIKWHDDYEHSLTSSWRNDIAIITLHDDVEVNKNQATISLPTEDVPTNVTGFVSGYSRPYTGSNYVSPDLKGMKATIISNWACDEFDIGAKILDNQICGKQPKGFGVCNGDSGGPLVYDGKVVGIASWNLQDPCGSGKPDVYTNVYRYLDFIRNVTGVE